IAEHRLEDVEGVHLHARPHHGQKDGADIDEQPLREAVLEDLCPWPQPTRKERHHQERQRQQAVQRKNAHWREIRCRAGILEEDDDEQPPIQDSGALLRLFRCELSFAWSHGRVLASSDSYSCVSRSVRASNEKRSTMSACARSA